MEGVGTLPGKDANKFRQLVKHYESKNFKKAIKIADKLLEKFPTHAETLAMKGLVLSYMNRKEDALAFAKKGLMLNLKSGMCWHTLGLIHKGERNWE
jgi:peptide alpha-N-acetyltransferase